MTGSSVPPMDLEAEVAAVGAEIDALAAGGVNRSALDARVARLCDAVLARPPAEAKALLPVLEDLIRRLDAAATALRPGDAPGDSPSPSRPARAAAAAYGAGQTRRRRGF